MEYDALIGCPAIGWGRKSAEIVPLLPKRGCSSGHELVTWRGAAEVCWVCGEQGVTIEQPRASQGNGPRSVLEAALSETLRGHTLFWWQAHRYAWGGLSAEELVDMGCYAAVASAVKDLIEHRNATLRESKALWFDPETFLKLSS